jgi:hypothetical protein
MKIKNLRRIFFGILHNPESEIHLRETGNFSWVIHKINMKALSPDLEKAPHLPEKTHLSFQKQFTKS